MNGYERDSYLRQKFGGSPILGPNDNMRIDIQRDINGGVMQVIRETDKPPKVIHISRDNAIGMALGLLEAAGVPIEETYRRMQAMKGLVAP